MEDMAPFLKLATEENWVAEPWEFEFLLSDFPQGCFAARADNGETVGFVTALLHERSGWIGNLIVAEQFRGRGIGAGLFRNAVEALQSSGAETVWLTASKSGAPLYEKHGFTGIDTIIRWVGTGRQQHAPDSAPEKCAGLASVSYDIDTHAWSDRRTALLDATSRRGTLLQNGSGFIVMQPCGNSVQIGPFSALDDTTAERLFEDAFRTIPMGTKVLVDAPTSNRTALRLFNRRNMKIAGSNLLMYAGMKPDYRSELIYGLATMGSSG